MTEVPADWTSAFTHLPVGEADITPPPSSWIDETANATASSAALSPESEERAHAFGSSSSSPQSPRLIPLTAGATVNTLPNKPCFMCHKRKVKCDRQRPCFHCASHKHDCFDRVGKRVPRVGKRVPKSKQPNDSKSLTKQGFDAAASFTYAAPAVAAPEYVASPNASRGHNFANPLFGYKRDTRVRDCWIRYIERFDRLSVSGELSDLLFGLEMLTVSVPPTALITIIDNWSERDRVYSFLSCVKTAVFIPGPLDMLKASQTIAKASSRTPAWVDVAVSDKDVPVAFMISTQAKATAGMPRVAMSRLLNAAACAQFGQDESTRDLVREVCRQLQPCAAVTPAASPNAPSESKQAAGVSEFNCAVAVDWIGRVAFLCEIMSVVLTLAQLYKQTNLDDQGLSNCRHRLQIDLDAKLRMREHRVNGDFQTPKVNSAFELLFGYGQTELRGLDICQVLYKVTSPEDWRLINILMLNASVGTSDMRLIIRCCNKFNKDIGPVLFSLTIDSEHPDTDTCSMSFIPLPTGYQDSDSF